MNPVLRAIIEKATEGMVACKDHSPECPICAKFEEIIALAKRSLQY